MIYVMSDIHGNYEAYKKMLNKIRFCDDDILYICGDVIDRGSAGMKILQDMMLRINVIPIMGNHEYMAFQCMQWLMQEVTAEMVAKIDTDMMQGMTEWMNVGGQSSIAEFYGLSLEERQDIIDYISEFSMYEEVEVNGKMFVLVHAGLSNFSLERKLEDYDLSELLFQKPDYEKVYFKDKYLVTGHTPTRIAYAADKGFLLEEIPEGNYEDRIFKKNQHIAVDAGCGFGGKLACLCMDTMEEFYV